MVWVRLDEQFVQHPKVVQVGPLGVALQVAALCYCNRYLTDGFVPLGAVRTLLDFSRVGESAGPGGAWGDVGALRVAEDLVAAGMWEQATGGFQIHDFHDYQPARSKVEAERERNSRAGKRSAETRAAGRRASGQQPVQQELEPAVSEVSSAGAAHAQPVPGPVPGPEPGLPPADGASSGSPGGGRQRSPSLVVIDGGAPAGTPDLDGHPDRRPDDGPVTAQLLLGEHLQALPHRPPKRVVGHLARELKLLVGEGIDPDAIRAGLARLRDRGLNPATLASCVNEALNPSAAGPSAGSARGSDRRRQQLYTNDAAMRAWAAQEGQHDQGRVASDRQPDQRQLPRPADTG